MVNFLFMFNKNISIFLLLSALLVTLSAHAEETETETEITDAIEVEFMPDIDVRPQIIEIDRIVAVVNEDVITRTELEDVIEATIDQLVGQGVQPPDDETMQSQLLESIITKRIQLQRAQEIGLSVSESELDETILRVAQENQLSLQEFYQALETDNIEFSKFRNDIRDEIIMVRLREREVNNQVNITEGEIDNYLRTQETSDVGGDEYLIAHILLTVPEQVDVLQNAEIQKRAELALEKLQEGVDFAQVAAEFSDAEDAMTGGILDWRPVTQMGPKFTEILTAMSIGELTPVVQSPIGYHILKLLDRRENETAVVIIDQTNARHILAKVNELTSDSDAHQRIAGLHERIEAGADFEEIAKLHSDDGSAASGGDLGWLSPGDTVPGFENAMNALKPGEISGPVQSTFGWHLIQVVERRTQDISTEHQRQGARQAIRARKADVVIQEWQRRLRDESYIEYRLEEG